MTGAASGSLRDVVRPQRLGQFSPDIVTMSSGGNRDLYKRQAQANEAAEVHRVLARKFRPQHASHEELAQRSGEPVRAAS